MALPKNSTPIYTLRVPSLGTDVKFRPFLIKDEKALLLAQQSEDMVVMVDTLKSVIKSCVQDEIDLDKLATFDLEYIFTQLRAKSIGELVDLLINCDTCTDEKAVSKVQVDLTTLSVEIPEGHTNKIPLFDDVGVVMKYPSIDLLKRLDMAGDSDINQIFDVVASCIDYIYNTEEVWNSKDQTKEELIEFLNNLNSDQFAKVRQFFETMPKLRKQVEYDCPVCKKHYTKLLEGLDSFF
jgi:hypothetical protein